MFNRVVYKKCGTCQIRSFFGRRDLKYTSAIVCVFCGSTQLIKKFFGYIYLEPSLDWDMSWLERIERFEEGEL